MTDLPTMKKATSSIIEEIGYDPATSTLFIKFVGGRVFSYKGVPAEIAKAAMLSESVGKYFHAEIKGKFEATMVNSTHRKDGD